MVTNKSAGKVALRSPPAQEHHTTQLSRTALLYAYRQHILQSAQLCVAAPLHIYYFLSVNHWRQRVLMSPAESTFPLSPAHQTAMEEFVKAEVMFPHVLVYFEVPAF
ncbi:hypothetical protein T10_2727 [Trichinella papuae]|uniref:Uncharacterized protein n=1 Tax=Trichinella papuae TaxID=268474 RepID=A0A0V1MU25_9BILA|nr:hypothetical protein T10_2727 [Trichinella papuae]